MKVDLQLSPSPSNSSNTAQPTWTDCLKHNTSVTRKNWQIRQRKNWQIRQSVKIPRSLSLCMCIYVKLSTVTFKALNTGLSLYLANSISIHLPVDLSGQHHIVFRPHISGGMRRTSGMRRICSMSPS